MVTTGIPTKKSATDGAFELNSVFEFSSIVNASLDLKFILNHFLLTLMGKLLSLRGVILLERKTSVYRIENLKGLSPELLETEYKILKIPKRLFYLEREDAKKYPWLKQLKSLGITLVIPLVARDHVVGLAGFTPSYSKNKLSEKETTYLKSISNIAAVAIEKGLFITELNQVNRQLDRKIQELNTLFELGKEFNTILDTDRLVKLLLFSVMGQVGVNRYILCLENNGEMNIIASKLDRLINEQVCTYFPSLSSPILVDGIDDKSNRKLKKHMEEVGIAILIPLQLQNKTKGILGLGSKLSGDKYSQKDMELLTSLGNLAMISIENARLFQEAIEKQRLEDDLLIAKEIQRGLLPSKLPIIPRYDIAATNISSKQVGGDYYDVIQLSDSQFVIAIGDVSGKGTPASLLMANLQATIRALVPIGLSLPALTKRVNDLIFENTTSGRFITFFWGILDTQLNRFNYVNAGHNPPFLLRANGELERLTKGGIIFGVLKPDVFYEEGVVHLLQNDLLLFFTDGISEAMSSAGIEFGEDRMKDIGIQKMDASSSQILSDIVEEVKKHSKNTIQSDDLTLIILKALT